MLRGLPDTYNIIRKLGEGGGGVVYLGYHRNLKKYVVLKKQKYVAADIAESRVEVDLLKDLKNPHLPQVLDFLDIDGSIVTVMEYIPGDSFKDYLERGVRFEERHVVAWAKELCQTLRYLHTQKHPIIHADVKPANIILMEDGHIGLIDFNISSSTKTGHGAYVFGFTPGYASPEQIAAAKYNQEVSDPRRWRSVDERADIYSFGATIYHILTGRKPRVMRSGEIADIRNFRPDISDSFATIIMRCLQLSPADRYQSADSLYSALKHRDEILVDLPGVRRRQRIAYGLCIVGLIASLALVVTGAWRIKTDTSKDYNALVRKIQMSVDDNDFENAEKYYEEATDLSPGKLSAYYYYALGLKKQADQAHRGSDYRRLILFIQDDVIDNRTVSTKQTGMADLYYLQGYAYDELGDYQSALECYKQAIDSGGENVDHYRDYAIALARNGDITGAESTLDEARGKGLDAAAIDYVEGEINYYEGLPMDALDYFQRAAADFEDETMKSKAYLSAAKCYDHMGSDSANIQYKIDMLKKAVDELSDDHNTAVLEQLAQAYDQMSSQDNAADKDYYIDRQIEIYEKMIENNGWTAQRYYNLIMCYLNLQNPDIQSASASAQEMQNNYPQSYQTYEAQAYIELSAQNQSSAPDYTRFRELYQKASELYSSETSRNDEDMRQLEIYYNESLTW
ncbi:MAG: protein kinase [Blautia sp.]|nr:protein kinase [Blautia sp.]